MSMPGMLHMAILRSSTPTPTLRGIDTEALASTGVVRVITGADLAGRSVLPCVWIPGGAESHFPSTHPMGIPGRGKRTGD